MRRYRLTVEGRTYEVEVDDARERPVVARVNGETFRIDVESDTTRAAAASRTAIATAGAGGLASAPPAAPAETNSASIVAAPLPGLVVAVAAEAGATVQRGDPLVTIEAMKMFNVIRSPRAGTIAVVHVAERKNVAQGDPLVTFSG